MLHNGWAATALLSAYVVARSVLDHPLLLKATSLFSQVMSRTEVPHLNPEPVQRSDLSLHSDTTSILILSPVELPRSMVPGLTKTLHLWWGKHAWRR